MGGKDIAWRLAVMGLAWLVGAFAQMHERQLLPTGAYGLGAALGVGLVVVGWRWRSALVLLALGTALLAAASTGARATLRLQAVLPAALEGHDIEVQGTIASLPRIGGQGTGFEFEVQRAWLAGQPVAGQAHVDGQAPKFPRRTHRTFAAPPGSAHAAATSSAIRRAPSARRRSPSPPRAPQRQDASTPP
jgi:competence protein ComEC